MWRKLLSFGSDVMVYGLGTVIGQVVSFLMLPLYTRYLSPSDYGILGMLGVASMLFAAVAPLGVGFALFRNLSFCKSEAEQQHAASTAAISVLVTTGVWLAIALTFSSEITQLLIGDTSQTALTQWTLVCAAFLSVTELARTVLRVQRRVKTIAVVNIIKTAVTILLTATLIVGFGFRAAGYVYASVTAEVIFFATYVFLARDLIRSIFNTSMWRSMLAYGVPIVPHRCLAIATILFGQYIVRTEMGLKQAGIYDMALKFALPVTVVINAIQSAWQPYKFEVHAKEQHPEEFLGSIFTFYVVIVMVLWVLGALWLPDVLRLMTTSPFHQAAYLLPVVLLARALQGLYFMFSSGIELTKNTRPMSLISFSGLVCVASLSLVLIPRYGPIGAAYADVAGWVAMSVVALLITRSKAYIKYEWKTAFRLFCAASGVVAVGTLVQRSGIVVRLPVLAACTLCFLILAQWILLLSPNEGTRIRYRLKVWRDRFFPQTVGTMR